MPHSASDFQPEKTKMYITVQEGERLRAIAAVHQEWLLLAAQSIDLAQREGLEEEERRQERRRCKGRVLKRK